MRPKKSGKQGVIQRSACGALIFHPFQRAAMIRRRAC
jgi:hypothetical protein